MGRPSADDSISGRDATVQRRRRGPRFRLRRRHRSRTPTSADTPSQERSPSSSVSSNSQQPSHLPHPDNTIGSSVLAIVVPLPIFHGDPDECPAAHIARFDRVCRANGDATSATAARVFPASLDADAALWYELTTAGLESLSPPPPWDAVRAAFLDFFRHPGAAARARDELKALRQRPGETVNRYHLRLQGIVRRFPDGGAGVPDALLKDAFVDGLHAEFKEWVAPQRPEALEEAVVLARSWESAEGAREAWRAAKEACRSAATKCAFCGIEGHREERCEVWSGMSKLLQKSSSSMSLLRGGGATASNAVEEVEGGGRSVTLERLGSAVSTRSTQCRCRKHQCSKKAVEATKITGGGERLGNGAAAAGQGTQATSFNLMDL